MTMGMMGRPDWTARWKPPFLKGSRSGFGLLWRVPSGNIHSETRRVRITFTAASRERLARVEFPRSMKMAPDMVINGPRGVYCSDFFDMMDVRFGIILEPQDLRFEGKHHDMIHTALVEECRSYSGGYT